MSRSRFAFQSATVYSESFGLGAAAAGHRPALRFRNQALRLLFVMRNLHRAAADKFADDGVAGNQIVAVHLRLRETFDGFQ